MPQITLLTGPERRRRWSDEERDRILAAAFAPGAVVANISRRFEVSTSLIYKWREQALAAGQFRAAFAPAVLAGEPVSMKELEQEPAAILVELANGSRVKISRHASSELVTARQVQEGLGRDPFAGDVFVFRGRSGSLIKALWHDGIGLSLYAKRLDRGHFVWPQTLDGVVALTAGQMSYLLEAIDWRNPQHTWRPELAG